MAASGVAVLTVALAFTVRSPGLALVVAVVVPVASVALFRLWGGLSRRPPCGECGRRSFMPPVKVG